MTESKARVTRIGDAGVFTPAAHVPLIIVGGGACGLVAALRAATLGIESVIVERDSHSMGSTALSSGFIPACASQAQSRAGVDDSVSLFVGDIERKTHGQAATDLAHAYAQASGPALDWLENEHSIPFELLDGFLYPGHSVRRMHAVPEKTGQALVNHLLAAAGRAGLNFLYDALVDELVVNTSGRVLGVRCQRPDESIEAIGCDMLLLACNGYGGNERLVAQWLPQMRGAVFAGHTGNDGSAVVWGEQLGAGLADMSGYQGHGSWADPHGMLVSWALMMRGAVQVNKLGQRFHDETGGYSEAAVVVLRQPGAIAFNVFDESLHNFAEQFPDFRDALAAGAIRRAANVDELAAIVGCDASALCATLTDIGTHTGSADGFGRVFRRPLQAPYFVVRVTGALFHTQGGLAIDPCCRVLRADGSAFANLLAAGGAARGVSANSVAGYLSGNGLLSAVAGGFIAAQSARDFLL